jgi:hypothetical protein
MRSHNRVCSSFAFLLDDAGWAHHASDVNTMFAHRSRLGAVRASLDLLAAQFGDGVVERGDLTVRSRRQRVGADAAPPR